MPLSSVYKDTKVGLKSAHLEKNTIKIRLNFDFRLIYSFICRKTF